MSYFSSLAASFPSCVLELSDHEIKDWFMPRDFMVSQTLFILGRRFLLHDCDEFTKDYYRLKFGITVFNPVDVKGAPREPLAKVTIILFKCYTQGRQAHMCKGDLADKITSLICTHTYYNLTNERHLRFQQKYSICLMMQHYRPIIVSDGLNLVMFFLQNNNLQQPVTKWIS